MIIVWTPDAIQDRRDQLFYIANDSPLAAVDQGELIDTQVDGLVDFTNMARPGREVGTRELVINGTSFIAVYRVRPRLKRIEVLRLLHSSQQWPKRKPKK